MRDSLEQRVLAEKTRFVRAVNWVSFMMSVVAQAARRPNPAIEFGTTVLNLITGHTRHRAVSATRQAPERFAPTTALLLIAEQTALTIVAMPL